MKKKLLSRNKELTLWRNQFHKREMRMWECVRRNKDYIHDFELFKSGKLNDEQIFELELKWNIISLEGLGDPSESAKNQGEGWLYYPFPGYPSCRVSYFVDYKTNRPIYAVFRPGKTVFPSGKRGRKLKDWEIRGQNKKLEKLTVENCPRWISVRIKVEPWFSKSAIEKELMAKFEEAYELVKDAQTVVLKKQSYGPRDDDTFEKFMMAYDYKDKNPGITLNDIAVRMITDATYENKKGKKRALPWAIDKVRYYLERADYYINEQGWKEL